GRALDSQAVRARGVAVVDGHRAGEAAQVDFVAVAAGAAVDDDAAAGGGGDDDGVGPGPAVDGGAAAGGVDVVLGGAVRVNGRVGDAAAVDRLGYRVAPGDLAGRLVDDVGGAAVPDGDQRIVAGAGQGDRRGQSATEVHRVGGRAAGAGHQDLVRRGGGDDVA